jgi:phytoene dehydrogenase-like protein
MLPVMAMSMHTFGLPVVKGGSSNIVSAFESLLKDSGVRIMLDTDVEKILVNAGRVVGLQTSQGT